jgi:SMI1-KNR4 cell-wall
MISKKSKIKIEPYLKVIQKFTNDPVFIEFFEQNNTATPEDSACLVLQGQELSFDFFLGRSTREDEDLLAIKNNYEHRIPEKYLPICQVNEIDYVCIGTDSTFYLWSRYKNDLYFDPEVPNKYKPQNENLQLIAKSFSEFLGMIELSKEVFDDADFEDDFDNPHIPFLDGDIEDEFKRPELFFKQSKSAIDVQLQKLQLSDRGQELLSFFKQKGLIK